MHDSPLYRPIFDFIAGLGLPIAETTLTDATFLPGIAIRDGGLLVDPARLRWPADLLHEAGHLAVLPPSLRAQAHDNLPGHDDGDGHDHAGEQEALAWAWAAAMHLGLPPDALIHEGGYRGKSRELLQMYAFGVYPGLRGLCALGMTSAPGFETPGFETPGVPAPGAETARKQTTAIEGMLIEGMHIEGMHIEGMHTECMAIDTMAIDTARLDTADTEVSAQDAPTPQAAQTGDTGAQPIRYPRMHRWLRL